MLMASCFVVVRFEALCNRMKPNEAPTYTGQKLPKRTPERGRQKRQRSKKKSREGETEGLPLHQVVVFEQRLGIDVSSIVYGFGGFEPP